MFWLFLKRRRKKKILGQSSHHGCFLQAFFQMISLPLVNLFFFVIIFEETWNDRRVLLWEHWQSVEMHKEGPCSQRQRSIPLFTREEGWAFWVSSWRIPERKQANTQSLTWLRLRQTKSQTTLGSHDFFPPLALLWGFLPGAPGCTWCNAFLHCVLTSLHLTGPGRWSLRFPFS